MFEIRKFFRKEKEKVKTKKKKRKEKSQEKESFLYFFSFTSGRARRKFQKLFACRISGVGVRRLCAVMLTD